jgi:hypothetical protein
MNRIQDVEQQIKTLKNGKRYIKLLTGQRNQFEDREFRNIQTNIKTLEIRKKLYEDEQFLVKTMQH